MAVRPSFQFYPADWRSNANLRRCSDAARGAWMDLLCILHDSDEYGISRWPIVDLARAAGVAIKLALELATKDVLKGADRDYPGHTYTPRHAGKNLKPVMLVAPSLEPVWFSSRLVRDEWARGRRGIGSRFDTDNQPPIRSPIRPTGAAKGDGPISSTSSTSVEEEVPSLRSGSAPVKKSRKQIPEGFPSERDLAWAKELWLQRGRTDLCTVISDEVEKFRDHHSGKLTASADWPASWRTWARNAIKFSNGAHNGRFNGASKPTNTDKHLAGIASLIGDIRARRTSGID